jgi:predicted esterase
MTTKTPKLPLGAFSPPLIYPPLKDPHSQTIILLHGRGSSASAFAPPLLATHIPNPTAPNVNLPSLREALPSTRFVFPTAPRIRATLYRRSIINQWYDGSGDWEETVLGHAGPTLRFLHSLIEDEIALIGGRAGRVVLGGISQGCAIGLVSLLAWEGRPLGGFVGMCGFVPLGRDMLDALGVGDPEKGGMNGERVADNAEWREVAPEPQRHGGEQRESSSLERAPGENGDDDDDGTSDSEISSKDDPSDLQDTLSFRDIGPSLPSVQPLQPPDPEPSIFDDETSEDGATQDPPTARAVNLLRAELDLPLPASNQDSFLSTPVFLGHGTQDDNVRLRYGRDAARVMRELGLRVRSEEYDGLGHWYSGEMLRDLVEFLRAQPGLGLGVGGADSGF